MIDFSPQEKRIMQEIGRTENGKNLMVILQTAKDHYSSIQTIDKGADYGAQVEGRKLFCDFVDEITKLMNTTKHRMNPVDRDDFE